MITIENKERLLHKPLGKRNFYVESIKEIYDIEPNGNGLFKRENERYVINITNRKYSLTITLDREGKGFVANDSLQAYKLKSSNGNILYLIKDDIRNMDKFIDRLRLVGLGK